MDGDCLPHSLKFEFPTIWNLKTKDVFLSYLFIYLSIYLPTYLPTYLSIFLIPDVMAAWHIQWDRMGHH